MSTSYHGRSGPMIKRGAFITGVWHCDCDPRMPAEKFQTKNGGKNHGRWFYTCQKPQQRRCAFFLWSDDATVREESAVINNSRSEPHTNSEPKTPKKTAVFVQPPTPFSRERSATLSPENPRKKLWPPLETGDHNDESFGWSSSGDEELATVAEALAKDNERSSRKTARTLKFDSPGKRAHTDASPAAKSQDTLPMSDEVVFTPRSSGLPSPKDTHSKLQAIPLPQPSTDLTSDVLTLLTPVNLPTQIEHDLTELLNRWDLRTQGIARGRDITRVAVQNKDKKIAELQARIATLEAEKETSRAVIAHLKQDIATSPKRPGRSRFGNR